MEQVIEHLLNAERLLGQLEQHQAKKHVRNGIKEWLLASRSIVDSVIDALEDEPGTPSARKIKISDECEDSLKGKDRR
ncbi:hypothetical protein [Paenibacillus sp. PL91]|uniref:hypothetical protein n=1 Tax=Paenibacillus sp. PL91 TaxID=2729538 RepID=UPI00145CD868|nr:hypothetical protein [Paenibacillus sp. PL91]MBC9200774.1 hypothetical protein [Paenibacillus sp. PL91]